MLFIIAFALAALLMQVSGKATGHPMAFVGVIYLGGIMYVFGLLALKIIGVST